MRAARSTSAPAGSRQGAGSDAATPAATPPPELEGCARSLPLHEARAAAAARKKPGYSHGLRQALLWRERRNDPKTAAAACGVKTGPYGIRAEVVPYALPGCLLRMDLSKGAAAAAAAAGGGGSGGRDGGAGGVSGGGSAATRAQRSVRGEAAGRVAGSHSLVADAGGVVKWVAGRPIGRKLALQRSGVHGYGLFAAERIRAHEFVIEYVGLLIRSVIEDVVEARYKAQGQDSSYLFRIDKQRVADATVWGGLARYINHSCAPNCYTKVFTGPDGVARMGIFAKRDVDLGEELHYDYMFEFEEGDQRVPCYCGAPTCRKWMNAVEEESSEDDD